MTWPILLNKGGGRTLRNSRSDNSVASRFRFGVLSSMLDSTFIASSMGSGGDGILLVQPQFAHVCTVTKRWVRDADAFVRIKNTLIE
jgi:hypothetical protein